MTQQPSTQIGEVLLTPLPDGRLALQSDEGLDRTTWTPAEVAVAVTSLTIWLASLEETP